jgi:serine/threonine-protein kinase RsbW
MWSHDEVSAKRRPPRALADVELEELRARCRRQSEVIRTLSELVATFKTGTRALKADNRHLQAENERLRSYRRAIPVTEAQLMTGWEPTEHAIPLGAHAPGVARSIVAQRLDGHVAPPVLEAAQLIVSELVTNSVRHSGLPDGHDVVVRVAVRDERCRVEVEDPSSDGVIAPSDPDADVALHVVGALTERWGVVRAVGGPTRVWAQLPCADAPADPRPTRANGAAIEL